MTGWKFYNPKFEFTKKLPIYSSAWSGHIFFAYDLVSNIKPKLIVELGTHKGNSLFSFAQAIKDNKLKTKLYGIDTWEGDKQAGYYGDCVYQEFIDIKNKYYKDVDIVPMRMLFDDALPLFKDNSIDILHIDGLHTYEAVKHDFDNWLPKVNKKNGIILFHDICEKKDDFGVYKFWDELQKKYNTLSFSHYHGLGVIFLGNDKIFKDKLLLDSWKNYYMYVSDLVDVSYFLKNDYLIKEKELNKIIQEKDGIIQRNNDFIKKLQSKINKLTIEVAEFRSFKNGKIWRCLEVYRKLKKSTNKNNIS